MKKLLILSLLMLMGCEDHYRYTCQNPDNFYLKECQKPKCQFTQQCPEYLVAPIMERKTDVQPEQQSEPPKPSANHRTN